MRGCNKIRGRTSAAGSGISVMHISVSPSFVVGVGILGVVVVLQVHIGLMCLSFCPLPVPTVYPLEMDCEGILSSLSFLFLRSSRFVRIAIAY